MKACLIGMEERGETDMELSIHKFCVSWFAIRVCCVGTKLAVESWNVHTIPGMLIIIITPELESITCPILNSLGMAFCYNTRWNNSVIG